MSWRAVIIILFIFKSSWISVVKIDSMGYSFERFPDRIENRKTSGRHVTIENANTDVYYRNAGTYWVSTFCFQAIRHSTGWCFCNYEDYCTRACVWLQLLQRQCVCVSVYLKKLKLLCNENCMLVLCAAFCSATMKLYHPTSRHVNIIHINFNSADIYTEQRLIIPGFGCSHEVCYQVHRKRKHYSRILFCWYSVQCLQNKHS